MYALAQYLKTDVTSFNRKKILGSKKVHAARTEDFLADTIVEDEGVFKKALEILSGELSPEINPIGPGSEYIKAVAQGLLYKVISSLMPWLLDEQKLSTLICVQSSF